MDGIIEALATSFNRYRLRFGGSVHLCPRPRDAPIPCPRCSAVCRRANYSSRARPQPPTAPNTRFGRHFSAHLVAHLVPSRRPGDGLGLTPPLTALCSSLRRRLAETNVCQQALETARTANRRLREEVKASTEELAAIKTQQEEDARRHSQSLVAARTALDEVRTLSCRASGVWSARWCFRYTRRRG